MNAVEIIATLSDEDRAKLICDIVEAIEPLLHQRPELIPGDVMSTILSVSLPTLDRLRRAGVVPSVTIGKRRLYRPEAVIAAIEAANGMRGDI